VADFQNADFQGVVRAKLSDCGLEPTREAEIVDEISQHLRDRYEIEISNGATEQEAERIVVAEFGQRDLAQELRTTERRWVEPVAPGRKNGFWAGLLQDLRYAARVLRMNPAFTAVCVLSLALGIGANTAIFQLINAVRMRTLPVKNPQELMLIRPMPAGKTGRTSGRYSYLTNPMWEQIQAQQQGFSAVAAFGDQQFNLERGGPARYVQGLWVSGEFFDMLGVQPVLGRVFHGNDDHAGCGIPGAVLSYRFWQHEFAGSSHILSKTVSLDGHTVPVIGVTPANFHGVDVGHDFDVTVPVCSEPAILGDASLYTWRHGWWLAAIGRLKRGWSREKATAQLEAISPGIMQDTLPPNFHGEQITRYLGYKLQAFPGATGYSNLRKAYESPLWLLLAIAGLVLLIACANLANLMLARANVRSREIAVRMALGANRARLIRQLVTESLVIAISGAVAGIALAQGLSHYLLRYLNQEGEVATVFLDLTTDWRVLGFAILLAIITCVLFGLMPALQATGSAPARMISLAGRVMTTREGLGSRRVLVVMQVALSLVLVVSALLFTRSLRKILTVDAGFQRDGLVAIAADFATLNVPKGQRELFAQSVLDKVRAVPGVESAAEVFIVPLSGNGWNDRVIVDGKHLDVVVDMNLVSDGYFKTMGTPLLAGRDFNQRDRANGPLVAIVNQEFARKVLGTQNPIGKTYRIDVYKGETPHDYEIVGLVKNTKYYDLRDEYGPIAYYPTLQSARDMMSTTILLRSNIGLQVLLPSVRKAIAEVNPAITIDLSLMEQQVKDSLLRERLLALLSSFFAALAALLATIGLYGLIAYTVARRTNEIGIRMALGAAPGQILTMVLTEAAKLVVIGIAVGILLAVVTGRSAASLLFGLKPYDPATMAIAAAALMTVAVAATLVPARRAARLDPMAALREE
jgi:predicted permease